MIERKVERNDIQNKDKLSRNSADIRKTQILLVNRRQKAETAKKQ